MIDVQDMTEAEYRLYKMRRFAAGIFRQFGPAELAEPVERGELDECGEMRVAAFFVDPTVPHGEEYLAAFEEFAEQVDSRRAR